MEKEFVVGDTFQFSGRTWRVYPAVGTNTCEGCDGKGHSQKALCELLPPCYFSVRADSADVIFKIIA